MKHEQMNSQSPSSDKDREIIKKLQQQIVDLQKSEAFFRAVTQNSSDIIIVVNKKADIIYVNPAIERYLGYRPEELIGKSGFHYILPAELPRALIDFGKALLTKETNIHNSFGIRHKDGSSRILEGCGVNLLQHPTVRGFVMNVQDVTDRRKSENELDSYRRNLETLVAKRTEDVTRINARLVKELAERKAMEDALKQSEKKYRDFLENAPIGVGIIDLSGKVIYINKRIEQFMGWSREEIIGQNGFGLEAFDDETRRYLLARFKARVNGEIPRITEIPIARKNNPPLWVEVITTILKQDETPVGAQMIFNDCTARKEAQEALRKSEERFRTLIQRSSDVITILDPLGRFIYNSPSIEVVFGYSPESIERTSFLQFIHPDDHNLVRKRLAGLIDKTYASGTTEFRALRRDGIWRTFETSGKNLLDYEGINGLVFITRDITERKQAEEERRELVEKLHRAEKLESLGTLAGGVAHDLNNVLGALVGYTQLMLAKTQEDGHVKKYLDNMMKSSEKASAIIQDLLTLARRGVNVKTQIINLNSVLAEFFQTPEFERIQSYNPHITFKTELAGDLRNIEGMPVHLAKAMMNLISNAAEAISGEGEVRITTANCRLKKPLTDRADVREGDYVVITVRDNGQGISAADIGRIFEPFYTKKVMGRSGTGLGLAVVWGTVKDHEGYIDVQSEPGKGSAFTIYLPATGAPLGNSPSQSLSLDFYRGRGESILVVDDLHDQREVASSLLTKLGYQVTTVASGEAAIDYLNHHSPDILVLDMLMDPGIDGLETYRRILQIHPKQKAIIVSGFSETKRVREAMELGVGAYVQKPYMIEDMGMALRKIILEAQQ